MKDKSNLLSKISTPYIWTNIRACKACWKCVDNCPGHVIGKAGFLWHKHIVIKNDSNCTGCKKCIQTCPYGIFNEIKSD